jgi:hypothetical protein
MTVTFEWKTGTPPHTGKYLITDKHGHVDADYWNDEDKNSVNYGWYRHYEEDVMAWCELTDIQSYPNKVTYEK